MTSRPHAIAWFAFLVIGVATAPGVTAQQQGKTVEPSPALTRIAEGIYVDLADPNGNAVSNAGVVVLEHSVLVFDTHFSPEAGEALAARIRATTTKPVRYVVLSHFHPDHTHGVQAFPNAQILGSTATRRDILQRDIPVMNRLASSAQVQLDKMQKQIAGEKDPALQENMRKQVRSRQDFVSRMSRIKVTAPALTTDDGMYIADGTRKVRLEYLGAGHTDGDLVLFLPDEKVAFVGDLFFNQGLPNTQDALILEWMKTLPQVLKLDAEKFVPGHGPVGTREDVKNFLVYLEELKGMVAAGIARGDGIEQLIRDCRVPTRFSSYQFQNFFPANIQQMYVELKPAQAAASPTPEPRRKPAPEKPKP